MASNKKIFDKIAEMSEEETSRRDFFKIAGKGVGGFALSNSIIGKILGLNNEKESADNVSAYPLAGGLLVHNNTSCTGCQRCEIICSTKWGNEACHPYMSGIHVYRNYNYGRGGPMINFTSPKQNGNMGNFTLYADTCRQCREPSCARVCASGAVSVNAGFNNARKIDSEKCTGCGVCTKACPWGMPIVSKETGKAFKCVACGECAKHCPNGALKLIPWEDVKNAMSSSV